MPDRLSDATRALRAQLGASLFRAAPAGGGGLSRAEGAVLVVAFLVLATVAQLLRIGPATALDSIWAEDGPIFLQGAISQGLGDALTSTYAGYFVLAPRLIGELGATVPLADAAAAIAIGSALVVALCGLVVWFASAGLIGSPYLRGTLAGLTVLAPAASLESVASGSYVLWYMLFASFWLLLWRPRATATAAAGALFVLATALSTPGVWFFAPLAALRALAIRDRRDALLVGAYALGAAIQVPALALSDEEAVEPLWSADIWTALLQRVLDAAVLGERLGGEAWAALGWPLLIGLLALAVVGLGLGLRRADASARWLVAIAVPTAIGMFVASAYQRAVGTQMTWPEGLHFGNGGRYAIVPTLLLVSVALVLVDRLPRRPGRFPWAVAATAAVLLAGMAISFDLRDPAARGTPPWRDALDTAAASCTSGVPTAPVPISPPGFGVTIPCTELLDASGAPPAR